MSTRMLAALVMTFIATAAMAHSTLKSTVPPSDSVLSASPPEVVINFNEPARLVSVIVARAGAPERKLQFTPVAESTTFNVAAPALENGRNEIKWRALSKDGHPISGTIVIVVKPAAATPKSP
ncbi:copper resistance protein CopC [Steroidobacter flavus]|uniref:Copper resistance protein C n=1 Tax=Steroidobacter flavus TaxID=1842136 RepID=A0ABV8SXM6_9GAMM